MRGNKGLYWGIRIRVSFSRGPSYCPLNPGDSVASPMAQRLGETLEREFGALGPRAETP